MNGPPVERASPCFLVSGEPAAPPIPLAGDLLLVGSGADCQVRIAREGVSRFHARLRRQPQGRWVIEDLDSRNGTYVNDRRIDAPATLAHGDRLRLGAARLVFDAGRTALASPPAAAPGASAAAPPEARRRAVLPIVLAAVVLTAALTSAAWFVAIVWPDADTGAARSADAAGGPAAPGAGSTSPAADAAGAAGAAPPKDSGPPSGNGVAERAPRAAAENAEGGPTAPPVQEIVLKDGARVAGRVVDDEDDPLALRVAREGGAVVRLPIEDVLAIDGVPFAPDWKRAFAARLERARDGTALARLLGWCREHGLAAEAREVARRIVEREPFHEDARRALGEHRYRGEWIAAEAAAARGLLARDGRLAGTDEERLRVRRLHLVLRGRPPLETEMEEALARPEGAPGDDLVEDEASHRAWCEREGARLGIPDAAFGGEGELASLPGALQQGSIGVAEALRSMAGSAAFARSHEGHEAFARAALGGLLELAEPIDPRVLEAAVAMSAGERAALFGGRGQGRSDLLDILAREPRFYRALLQREARALRGEPLSGDELAAAAYALAGDPAAIGRMRSGWLGAGAAAAVPRAKSVEQVRRGLAIDLFGREASPEEREALRRALPADLPPWSRVGIAARALLDAQPPPEVPSDPDLARAWIERRFLAILGRRPAAPELEAFARALTDEKVPARTLVLALVTSPAYLVY